MDNAIYNEVRFGIESGYKWGEGMTNEAHDRFYAEVIPLFEGAGWTIEGSRISMGCPTARKGVNHLYLHPMEFSGVLEVNMQEHVLEWLESCGAETFCLDGCRILNRVYNWTDEEYRGYLEDRRASIEADLLEGFKTARKNLYKPRYGVIEDVTEKYKVHLANKSSSISTSHDVDVMFVEGLFNSLVSNGKILSAETRRGVAYRTAKKGETA